MNMPRSSTELLLAPMMTFDGILADPEPAATPAVDPATVAARVMLRAALAADPGLGAAAAADGAAVVVQVPGPEWTVLLADQWQLLIRGGVDPEDGDEPCRDTRREWLSFERDEPGRGTKADPGNARVQQALWHGRSVVGFSPSPEHHLPADLLRAADLRVEIAPLGPREVRIVLRAVAGRRSAGHVDSAVARMFTPAILRLARRPGQTPADYLARMVSIAARSAPVGRPGPTLEELKGMPEAVGWGLRVIRDLADYRRGGLRWADMDRGLLLHGAPGTGKTLFAEAFSRSSGLPLVATSFSAWQSSKDGNLGECLKAMRAVFDDARRRAPCILFIDELDAVGDRATCDRNYRGYWTSVVTTLLELLDGVGTREGVFVLGATNHPHTLDPAIVRSGRMDRTVGIGLPDVDALDGILRHHLGADLVGADLTDIVRAANGSTGADCARFVRGARQAARHAGRPLEPGDLLLEVTGPTRSRDPDLTLRIAVHEAGHAVAVAVLRPGKLVGADILATKRSGGMVEASPCNFETEPGAIRGEILEVLAGRAAEQAVLGAVTSGSGGSPASDLCRATVLAVAEESAFGLGGAGLVWSGLPGSDAVAGFLAMRPGMAERVRIRLAGVYDEAVSLARAHEAVIRVVAAELMLRGRLTGQEVEELVGRHLGLADREVRPGCLDGKPESGDLVEYDAGRDGKTP